MSTRKKENRRVDFGPVIEFIGRHDRFILTVHETPDGDALGSEYALLRVLRRLGKQAQIFNADPAPEKFAFIAADGDFPVLKSADQLPADIDRYVLVILDVSDLNNIGQIASLVLPHVQRHLIIDHHEGGEDILSGNLIQKDASSTSEILYTLFLQMGVEIDLPIAQALYTGIVFDTGSFIYPKTTALTFEIARDLVSLGVNPNQVYANVYESNSIPALVLQSRVMATLQLTLDNHVAFQTMTRDMIEETGARYEEADQIINIPLRSRDIRVSVFFKENTEGLRRCSMRSKGNIDVAAIAQKYGGGGHRTAAGFKCRLPFERMQTEILQLLQPYFDQERA